MVDSHAHLADPAFDADRDATIDRARAAGLHGIVCIGESLAAAERAFDIATRHPGFVYHTAGVHPHDAATFESGRDLEGIRAEVARGAVAIGECGLDNHYDHAPKEQQRRAFDAQLALAAELRLPVVVHSREAVEDTSAMVRAAGDAGVLGVMHCFGGPESLADVALTAGWYISFAGVITFKKWHDDGLLRAIPMDRLLVETDAPYLAPVPYRGKRNEPAFVCETLAQLARVRGDDVAVLGTACANNARRLFTLAVGAPRA
ncbi:MAG: TatD family hydrolase [Gemmatimonadaceae bacterium]